MSKRFITIPAILALVIALLLPAAAIAQDNTDEIVGIFGEVIDIDQDSGTITVKFKNGETAVIGADTGFEAGPDWQMGLGDLAIGDRVSAMGRQTPDGQYYAETKFFVKPTEPQFTHKSGVMNGGEDQGWEFQDQNGIIIGGWDCIDCGEQNFQNGEVFTGVFMKGLQNSNTNLMPTNFKPFEEIISGVGNNLQGMTFPGASALSDETAFEITNFLGNIDQYLPPQVKTETKTKIKNTLSQSMPQNAWSNLPDQTGKGLNLEAWGFVPDDAFGQMDANAFGNIPDDAFAYMDANAFANMPAEAFGKINPIAFGKMPTEAFGKIDATAFGNIPDDAFNNMKPEAFGQIPSGMQAIIAGKGPLSGIPVDLVNTDPELYNQMANQAFQDFWAENNVPLGENGLPTIIPGSGIDSPPAGTGWTQSADGGWIPPDNFSPPAWWDAPEGWTGGSLPDGTAPWQQWTPGMEGSGMTGAGTMGPGGPAIGDPTGGISGGTGGSGDPTGMGGIMPGDGWTQGADGTWTPPEGFTPPDWWDGTESWTGGTISDGQTPWQQWTPGMEDGSGMGGPGDSYYGTGSDGAMGPGGAAIGDSTGGMTGGMTGGYTGGYTGGGGGGGGGPMM